MRRTPPRTPPLELTEPIRPHGTPATIALDQLSAIEAETQSRLEAGLGAQALLRGIYAVLLVAVRAWLAQCPRPRATVQDLRAVR